MTIRVVVADDQEVVRAGIAALLGAQDGIEVVGEAADGAPRWPRRPARSRTSWSWTSGCPAWTA